MKKLWINVAAPGLMALTLWACQPELESQPSIENAISVAALQKLIVPEGALVFADGDDLANALESLKAGTFDADQFTQNGQAFRSMYSYLVEAEQAADAIVDPLLEIPEDQREDEVEVFHAAEKALAELEKKYQGIVVFENNYPKALTFDDRLMAQLLTRDGLVVVGSVLMRYTPEGIRFADLSTERNVVSDVMGAASSNGFSALTFERRTPVMAEEYCSTADSKVKGDIEVRVRNTYVPITQTRRTWVPEDCSGREIECPTGDDCDFECLPGHWVTRTVVVGERLTNSRVRATIKTRKAVCFIICFAKKEKTQHNLTISGMGLNEDVSGKRSDTDVEYDLPIHASFPSLTVNAEVPSLNLWCHNTLYWRN